MHFVHCFPSLRNLCFFCSSNLKQRFNKPLEHTWLLPLLFPIIVTLHVETNHIKVIRLHLKMLLCWNFLTLHLWSNLEQKIGFRCCWWIHTAALHLHLFYSEEKKECSLCILCILLPSSGQKRFFKSLQESLNKWMDCGFIFILQSLYWRIVQATIVLYLIWLYKNRWMDLNMAMQVLWINKGATSS